MKRLYWLATLCFLWMANAARAQHIGADTSSAEVLIEWSDELSYEKTGEDTLVILTGNVVLRHDSTRMFCDSAVLRNSTDLTAWGNVMIEHGDSLVIFADSLRYSGIERKGSLYGDVILERGPQRMFTARLDYDFEKNLAYYFTGALLTNDTTHLRSQRGYYYVDENAIYFKDSVVVVDTHFVLRADTLKFLTESRRVEFLGPTLIHLDTLALYCEGGWFDIPAREGAFTRNPQFIRGRQEGLADSIFYRPREGVISLEGNARIREGKRAVRADRITYEEKTDRSHLVGKVRIVEPERTIRSDTVWYYGRTATYATRGPTVIWDEGRILQALQIDYDDSTGLGIARGAVVWRDTARDWTIRCAEARYHQKTGYLKAYGGAMGRPLFLTEWDGDTLYLAADTLMSWQPDDSTAADSSRYVAAWYDVRVYKSDLQALCDSLAYFSGDSLFRFFGQPVVWADTSQLSADTIWMQMAEEAVDWMLLRPDALILNSEDEVYFNQVRGRQIKAYFRESELYRMHVAGNAEAVYYLLDEDRAYIGVNKTTCGEMWVDFGDNEVEGIHFLGAPVMEVLPMKQADHESLKLKGFRWLYPARPRSVEDLFKPEKPVR